MTYLKAISFLFALGLAIAACDPLEVEPTDKIPAEEAITDQKGVEAALNGVYDVMQSPAIAQDVLVFGDLVADNLIHIGTKKEYRQISDRNIVSENAYNEDLWNNSYDGINRLNNILASLDELSEVPNIDYYEGQTRFLRAFFYFHLANFWETVPVKTQPTTGISKDELNVPASTKDSVYSFVLSDLKKAEQLMEGTGLDNPAFASEIAVKALMARVYLYQGGQWNKAAEKALEVLNYMVDDPYAESNAFTQSSFDALWDESTIHPMVIFMIDFTQDNSTNSIADWFMPDGRFEVAAWENFGRDSSIADHFSASDLRYESTIGFQNDEYFGNKYQNIETDKDNAIFFRTAEMYLIRAEALNELGFVANGEAFDMLNMVRKRAGLAAYSAGNLRSQADFRKAVLQERRLELAFEGHRFFDLRRMGLIDKALSDIGTLKDNNWYFPIPQSEKDLNEAID